MNIHALDFYVFKAYDCFFKHTRRKLHTVGKRTRDLRIASECCTFEQSLDNYEGKFLAKEMLATVFLVPTHGSGDNYKT